jgi:ABC-type nitrate/sulfonate/bicarbonate transport system permease component
MSEPRANALLVAIQRYWGVAAILIGWQAWVLLSGVNSIIVPHPAAVVGDIFANPGLYLTNAGQTLLLAAAGLLLGMFLGTGMAILAWSSRVASGILVPLGLIFSSVPVVALIPILARVLGYDLKTVLGIVAIISFFPAFVFTASGLRQTPPGSEDLFRALGASRWRRFVHLILPSAVPNWLIALRLTAPPAVLAAMIAEFLMGQSGMGVLFREATTQFATERTFGTSLIATIISVLCFSSATLAERTVNEYWRA